jgi:hypothetical protein
VESTVTAQATPTTLKVKKDTSQLSVSVSADGVTPTGTVEAYLGQTKVGQGTLTAGSTTFRVGPFGQVGATQLSIRYLGDDAVEPGQTTLTLSVEKQKPKMSVALDQTVKKGARPTTSINLTAASLAVTGKVKVAVVGKTVTKRLSGGATKLRLPKLNRVGKVKVRVTYLGNGSLTPVLDVITMRVSR